VPSGDEAAMAAGACGFWGKFRGVEAGRYVFPP
jgi:hypothetical protein